MHTHTIVSTCEMIAVSHLKMIDMCMPLNVSDKSFYNSVIITGPNDKHCKMTGSNLTASFMSEYLSLKRAAF